MKQTIYVDVLFVINMYVNYFLLLSVARIIKIRPSKWRLLAASALGGLYSVMMFLTELDFLSSVVAKLILSLSIVFCAYKRANIKLFIKLLGCFYCVNFVYAGIMIAVWLAFKPENMIISNSVVYFDVSMLLLIVTTIVCYVIILILNKVLRRTVPDDQMFYLKIEADEKSVEIISFLDTGNALTDAFTGMPVIVAEYDLVKPLIPEELQSYFSMGDARLDMLPDDHAWKKRLRLIPYESIGAGGMLPAFKPDNALIKRDGKVEVVKDVLIGVCSNRLPVDEYGALLNPQLVSNVK